MGVALILNPETGQIGLHGWDGANWVPLLVDATGKLQIITGVGAPAAHAVTHENAGADEISVLNLSGLLADSQTPLAHQASHENGGGDEISVLDLSGLLADSQTPLAHKASHESGGADVVDADTVDAKHAIDLLPVATSGTNVTLWTIAAASGVWEDDPHLDITITLNVTSTIIVIGSVNFASDTVATASIALRYILDDATPGDSTGNIGMPIADTKTNPAVTGVFTGVASGARKIELQALRVNDAHTVKLRRRTIAVMAFPE